MNELKEREKEKKQKLKQLEAEIKEMKRDHKETFAVMSRPSLVKKPTSKQLILASVGAFILIAAVLWLWLAPPTFNSYAVFRIGKLRFTRSIFFLPLTVSMLAFIIVGKRKKALLFLIPSAVIAMIGATVTIKTELLTFPVWTYAIAYSFIFLGIGAIAAAFLQGRK